MVILIPVEVKVKVTFLFTVTGNCIVFLEHRYEVIGTFFANIFHAKFINIKGIRWVANHA